MTDVRLSKQAQKILNALQRQNRQRIINTLKELQETPFPAHTDIKKIRGIVDTYRIRIGSYRVIYYIDWEENAIYVMKIDKRSRAYRSV